MPVLQVTAPRPREGVERILLIVPHGRPSSHAGRKRQAYGPTLTGVRLANGSEENMNDTFDPRFDPAFQPGFDGSAGQAKAPKSSNPAKAALEAARSEAVAAPEADDDVESVPRARANPFLVALTVISVALIAGGFGTSQWIRSLFLEDDIRLDLDFFSLDTLKIAAPLAVALGIAIGAGVLFVYAVRWNKKD